jgi:hypothetical protein
MTPEELGEGISIAAQYYRIYVDKFTVYYVVIDEVMEVSVSKKMYTFV